MKAPLAGGADAEPRPAAVAGIGFHLTVVRRRDAQRPASNYFLARLLAYL
jgi:hypothetical protein